MLTVEMQEHVNRILTYRQQKIGTTMWALRWFARNTMVLCPTKWDARKHEDKLLLVSTQQAENVQADVCVVLFSLPYHTLLLPCKRLDLYRGI